MNVLLAITGSIASFKSYDVARSLVKKGHEVKIILTQGALEFIRPETFRYLGVSNVFLPHDDFIPGHLSHDSTVLHIELAKWADKLVVAPLSANTLARLSLGLNNDLLGSTYLALGKKTVLMFPAMNTEMWNHPRTQQHVSSLKELPHVAIVSPVSGLLACGDVGAGKFPEVEAVVDLIETHSPLLQKKKSVIVTAGATAAPIDPVRYVTNPSSGIMGKEVAMAFLKAGYEVTVLAGHNCDKSIHNLEGHPRFHLIRTPTTKLMRDAAVSKFPESDLYISTGAIADIEFDAASSKIKKESMGTSLAFHQAPDILKEILALKKNGQKVVSFAAETETTEQVFREKMNRKPVDLMIGNKVSNGLLEGEKLTGFQNTESAFFFVSPKETRGPLPMTKRELAQKLLQWFEGFST
jgi:phosphopantothenoylcysteine decarboxylase/phosphopantothenate--cysteine ligase